MTDYSFREQQNNAEFDRLALTLHQFRQTVDHDIHGSVQQENSLLNSLEEGMLLMMASVSRTRTQLLDVINRQLLLTKLVGAILVGFILLYVVWKVVF